MGCSLEILDNSVNINGVWENIGKKQNSNVSSKESSGQCERKQHKGWFGEQSSKFVGQKKWLNCDGYRILAKIVQKIWTV
jgi:hypothetical protein